MVKVRGTGSEQTDGGVGAGEQVLIGAIMIIVEEREREEAKFVATLRTTL